MGGWVDRWMGGWIDGWRDTIQGEYCNHRLREDIINLVPIRYLNVACAEKIWYVC